VEAACGRRGGSGAVLDAVASPAARRPADRRDLTRPALRLETHPFSRLALLPPALVVVVFRGLAAWARVNLAGPAP
jgi:hypothetical protein